MQSIAITKHVEAAHCALLATIEDVKPLITDVIMSFAKSLSPTDGEPSPLDPDTKDIIPIQMLVIGIPTVQLGDGFHQ